MNPPPRKKARRYPTETPSLTACDDIVELLELAAGDNATMRNIYSAIGVRIMFLCRNIEHLTKALYGQSNVAGIVTRISVIETEIKTLRGLVVEVRDALNDMNKSHAVSARAAKKEEKGNALGLPPAIFYFFDRMGIAIGTGLLLWLLTKFFPDAIAVIYGK